MEDRQYKLSRYPLIINTDKLPDFIKEQTTEVKHNINAEQQFQAVSIKEFLINYPIVYPQTTKGIFNSDGSDFVNIICVNLDFLPLQT